MVKSTELDPIFGPRLTYEQVVDLWFLFRRWDTHILHGGEPGMPNPDAYDTPLPSWIQPPITVFGKPVVFKEDVDTSGDIIVVDTPDNP